MTGRAGSNHACMHHPWTCWNTDGTTISLVVVSTRTQCQEQFRPKSDWIGPIYQAGPFKGWNFYALLLDKLLRG